MTPIEALYAALEAPFGVVVESDDPKNLRQQLYAARAQDPALACISITPSRTNPATELWLVRRPDETA